MPLTNTTLLPIGFYDLLGSEAELYASLNQELTALFSAYGYEQVIPPLMEFENSLFAGGGNTLEQQTFRVMDPLSHRMMGLRADMTTQVGRIATTLLKDAPRPLRLCYAGNVLRVKAVDLHADRQLGQAGIELVGAATAAADAEVVLIALDALERWGIKGLSVDFSLPTLVKQLLADIPADLQLQTALQKKDLRIIQEKGGQHAAALMKLAAPTGSAEAILELLRSLSLPALAKTLADRLEEVISLLRASLPECEVTIDPLESTKFHYHTGIAFSLFSREAKSELGRGGRYRLPTGFGEEAEEAVGCTLYVNTLCRLVNPREGNEKCYVQPGTPLSEIREKQQQGLATVFHSRT